MPASKKKLIKAKPRLHEFDLTVVGYYAGLFDGEGSVHVAMRKDFRSVVTYLEVSNTHPEALYKGQGLFGGTVTRLQQPKENHKDYYSWRLSGKNSTYFASTIVKNTIIKRNQLEIYILIRHLLDAGRSPSRSTSDARYAAYQYAAMHVEHFNKGYRG